MKTSSNINAKGFLGWAQYESGLVLRSFCAEVPEGLRWFRWGSGDAGDAVHGYVEDWRLEAIWRGSLLGSGEARFAVEPDFSVVRGMPEALVRYQVYRARWCGYRLRSVGMTVVPTLQWGDGLFDRVCVEGIEPGSWVAVRAPGRGEDVSLWAQGFLSVLGLSRAAGVLVFGVSSRCAGVLSGLSMPVRSFPLRRSRSPLPNSPA